MTKALFEIQRDASFTDGVATARRAAAERGSATRGMIVCAMIVVKPIRVARACLLRVIDPRSVLIGRPAALIRCCAAECARLGRCKLRATSRQHFLTSLDYRTLLRPGTGALRGFSGIRRRFGAVLLLAFALVSAPHLFADDVSKSNSPGLVPLKLKFPEPVFAGTPREAPRGVDMEPTPAQPPPPLMVPSDVRNVAPGKKISCSDKGVTASALARITDGNKSAEEDSAALLRKGLQLVQFDLGAPHEIFAIVFWHAHDTPKVYRSVIVQVADDADFTQNVRTLYNNDRDNSAGLGAGTDRQYFETYMGKTVDAKGARARYVRLYSHGSTDSALNEYTEVEIYGRPAR